MCTCTYDLIILIFLSQDTLYLDLTTQTIDITLQNTNFKTGMLTSEPSTLQTATFQ